MPPPSLLPWIIVSRVENDSSKFNVQKEKFLVSNLIKNNLCSSVLIRVHARRVDVPS